MLHDENDKGSTSQKKIDVDSTDPQSKINHTIFFIDGPGGTGKTFFYDTLMTKVRSKGDIALAVASSGVSAVLLKNGRTAHSRSI